MYNNIDVNNWFISGDNSLPETLSKSETKKLVIEMYNGNRKAREELITHNIRLVIMEVKNKFSRVKYEMKELVAIGNFGLIKAIDTYDLSKGYEISTYATSCIDNEILMFLRKLKRDNGIDSLDRVIIEPKCTCNNKYSLIDTTKNNDDFVLDYESNEIYRIIRDIVDGLPDLEKEIITMLFGFNDSDIYKQYEIAERLNISNGTVCRNIDRILNRIKDKLEKQSVIEVQKHNVKSRKITKNK